MVARLIFGFAAAMLALPAQAADSNLGIDRAWAAGYRAAFTCSALWNGAGKPLDAIERDELTAWVEFTQQRSIDRLEAELALRRLATAEPVPA